MESDDTFFKTNDFKFIDNYIEDAYFYPLPFEEYVTQFYEQLRKDDYAT